jgi:hypothetical protein
MTFSDLDDAFEELERRADAADDLIGVPAPGQPRRRYPSSRVRVGPVAAAVATVTAVAAVAVGVGYASTGHSHHPAGAGIPPTPSTAPLIRSSTAPSTATSTAKRPAVSATDVPKTQAALIARFRSILGGTATITVDSANSTDKLITGVLTSTSGTRGLYVLELDKNVAICGSIARPGQKLTPLPCPHVTTRADGSRLKVDRNFPDGPPHGVMNDAILSRPDGWQISLYTANVQGKYYGAPLLGKQPALTTADVTDVVTSPAWVKK